VKNIEWNVSANGLIIPTIILEPIVINNICIKRVSGHNAKYIKTHILGKGSKVNIIRSGDTIPYIENVLSNSDNNKPEFPNDIEWEWDNTNTHIQISNDINYQYKIKNIYHFFKTIKVEKLGIKNIMKLYNNGFDNIEKIINLTYDNLVNIDGYQSKSSNDLLNSIKTSINNVNIETLMVASNKLGNGIGGKKINQILKKYPNIIELYNNNTIEYMHELLMSIDGWAEKTVELFINNLKSFIIFYNNIKKYITIKDNLKENIKNTISTTILVSISGWRPNKDVINIFNYNNIQIIENINKNVNFLIVKNTNTNTTKIKFAKKNNIKIVQYDDFLNTLTPID
jgi:NAD-dependent DNA ligase